MKTYLSKIPQEFRSLALLLLGIVFLGWLFLPRPPITYQEAYQQVYQQIREHCKQMNYEPCDYKLVRFEGDKTKGGSGIFIFESAYRKPISVGIYSDGDADFVDSNIHAL